jgi:hypothetical protein
MYSKGRVALLNVSRRKDSMHLFGTSIALLQMGSGIVRYTNACLRSIKTLERREKVSLASAPSIECGSVASFVWGRQPLGTCTVTPLRRNCLHHRQRHTHALPMLSLSRLLALTASILRACAHIHQEMAGEDRGSVGPRLGQNAMQSVNIRSAVHMLFGVSVRDGVGRAGLPLPVAMLASAT